MPCVTYFSTLCSANNNNNVKFIKMECLKRQKLWVFRILRKLKFIIFTILFKLFFSFKWLSGHNELQDCSSSKIILDISFCLVHGKNRLHLPFPYPIHLLLSPQHATRNWGKVFDLFQTKEEIEYTSVCKVERRVCFSTKTQS